MTENPLSSHHLYRLAIRRDYNQIVNFIGTQCYMTPFRDGLAREQVAEWLRSGPYTNPEEYNLWRDCLVRTIKAILRTTLPVLTGNTFQWAETLYNKLTAERSVESVSARTLY